MKRLFFYVRIYRLLAAQQIKTRMEYRADFVISTFGMVMTNISGIFALWIVFHSISDLAGWDYNELIFIYSFTLLSLLPLQLFFDNIWSLGTHIVEGTFIKYYLRPLDILFYFISDVFDVKGFGQLLVGIVAMVYSSIHLGISWNFFSVFLLFLLLFSSSLVMIALMLIASASGFWIQNPTSALLFVFKFRDFAYYPLSLFNSFFKFLFTFVIPIGFIAFYPVQLIIRPEKAGVLVYCSPLVSVALLIIAYLVWTKGAQSYAGTGS